MRLQRSRGALRVSVRLRDGETALENLRQEGCLKARFPRPVDWTEIVTLNTAGGIAGGDVLAAEFQIGAGAKATIASQAAERFYRALPLDPPSRVRTRIVAGAGAAVEWLPQESILFDRSRIDRALDVSLAADAWFLGMETLVFGRAAMGETMHEGSIRDLFRVERDGELLLHDAVRMEGPIADLLARPAVANGGRAVATVVHVAPDAEMRLDKLRAALEAFDGSEGNEAGASAWRGMLVARIVARDGACLRSGVVAGLTALRGGRALPRVWNC